MPPTGDKHAKLSLPPWTQFPVYGTIFIITILYVFIIIGGTVVVVIGHSLIGLWHNVYCAGAMVHMWHNMY